MATLDFLAGMKGAASAFREDSRLNKEQEKLVERLRLAAKLERKNDRRRITLERKFDEEELERSLKRKAAEELSKLDPKAREAAGYEGVLASLTAGEAALTSAGAAVNDAASRHSLLDAISEKAGTVGVNPTALTARVPVEGPPQEGRPGPTRGRTISELRTTGRGLAFAVSSQAQKDAASKEAREERKVAASEKNAESGRITSLSGERTREGPRIASASQVVDSALTRVRLIQEEMPDPKDPRALTRWVRQLKKIDPTADPEKHLEALNEKLGLARVEFENAYLSERLASLGLRGSSADSVNRPGFELPDVLRTVARLHGSNPDIAAGTSDAELHAQLIADPEEKEAFLIAVEEFQAEFHPPQ